MDVAVRRKRVGRYLVLAILLLAFSLRLYRLDAQSFWNDEGNSARLAERALPLVLAGAGGDIHPPGYYVMLHFWRMAAGSREFALRYPSVFAGVVAVLFTYALGKRLFGSSPGATAAFLGSVSPLAVYYSQEARMYALLAALSAASTYFFLRLDGGGKAVRAGYVLLAAAGLYTHYSFPFVLLVHNLLFFLRPVLSPTMWMGMQLSVLGLYLPWVPTAIRSVTGWPAVGGPSAVLAALVDVVSVLTVGVTLPPGEATMALWVAGMALAGGFVRPSKWFSRAVVAVYLLSPIVLIFAFGLYKPAWLKFFVVVLPPFHIGIAAGARGRPFWLKWLLVAAVTVSVVPSLRNLYFDPAYARDDYRRLAADLLVQVRPGDDGIVLDAPNQWEVFTYYYPDRDVYPIPYRPSAEEVGAFLDPLFARYRRLFVLYWGDAEADPQRLVESALAAQTYKFGARWYGRVRLVAYAVAALPVAPEVEVVARFGEHVLLRGYALSEVTAGVLPVTLFWQADGPVTERYKVTVQLLDETGHLVSQVDTEPLDGLAPTTTWSPGAVLADRYGLVLPPELPTGRYGVIVGVYHVVTGERLPVTVAGRPTGDHYPLTEISG